jgi:hypothetical protein
MASAGGKTREQLLVRGSARPPQRRALATHEPIRAIPSRSARLEG